MDEEGGLKCQWCRAVFYGECFEGQLVICRTCYRLTLNYGRAWPIWGLRGILLSYRTQLKELARSITHKRRHNKYLDEVD